MAITSLTASEPFAALLRRATKCGYGSVVFNNRLIMQCYDLDIDSDTGLHYILPIPETKEYDSDIYDMSFIIEPAKFLKVYSPWYKEMETARKERKIKPKDATAEFCLKESGELKFVYYLEDELIGSLSYQVQYPIDHASAVITNIEETYQNLIERIRPGGACLIFDGLRLGLQEKAYNCSEVYFHRIRYAGKKVRIPLYRSLFHGIREVDQFIISIQESLLPDIYVYTVQYTKKNIAEIMWGYCLAF